MSIDIKGPVSFGEFGDSDRALYKYYLDTYRMRNHYVDLSGVDTTNVFGVRATTQLCACARMDRGFCQGEIGDAFARRSGEVQVFCRGVERGSFGESERSGGGAFELRSGVSRGSDFESGNSVDGLFCRDNEKEKGDFDFERSNLFGKDEGERHVERSEIGFDEGRNFRSEDVGENLCGRFGDLNKGKHWKKNQKKAEKRKKKNCNVKEHEESSDWRSKQNDGSVLEREVKKDSLRLSLEKKWALENELKAAKAARELELLKAEDLMAVKKLRERKLQGATERTMVQIEKAHASLIRSGDVPGVQQGFCQTVVDGEVVESVPGLSGGESGGCSISPSSSISEREVRNMMKELEDLKKELEGYRRKDRLEADTLRMYNESVPVTLDENELVPDEVIEMAGDKFEGPEYFTYGKIYEENGKKYRTMKFDRENYSRYGEEHW